MWSRNAFGIKLCILLFRRQIFSYPLEHRPTEKISAGTQETGDSKLNQNIEIGQPLKL